MFLGTYLGCAENALAATSGIGQPIASSLPWYIARSAGITAYILMFCIIALGETMTTGSVYALITPVKAWTMHKYLGIAFGIMLLVHMFSLLFDTFMNFSVANILIPFSSSYSPVFLSMGIFGFYIVLAVLLSSLLVRLRFPSFWRYIHYLVYPLFVLGFFHGVFLGTDTTTLAMQIVYAFTGMGFILLMLHRWRFSQLRA